MKRQQKFSAPVGYKLLNELDRNRRATGTIERKPKYDLSREANPFLNIGGKRKSRKPVTLAKKA
jgi:hypothetical protein